jgi:protein-disulfide isomerase
MGEERRDLTMRIAAWLGILAMLELLGETKLGFTSLTTGSPLAYRGVLVEMPAAIWFAVFLLLESAKTRFADLEVRRRWNLYAFVWTVVGLAAALWALRHSDESVRNNWQYWTACGCISFLFVGAGFRELPSAGGVISKSPRQLLLAAARDIRFLVVRLSFGLVVVACGMLVAFGPYARDVPSRREHPLHGTQLVEWFEMQPRTKLPQRYRVAPVVVATFIDYQCPACLSSTRMLEPLFEELAATYRSKIGFVTIDFPLEGECNRRHDVPANLHPAACEAAVAVRLAQRNGTPVQPLVEWIWNHQRDLSRDKVFKAAEELTGLEHVEADYQDALAAVSSDASLAYGLGVRTTPSYWINGVITRRRGPEDMRTLIVHELQKVEVTGGRGQRPTVRKSDGS